MAEQTKDFQIGFHEGSLQTLINEKKELLKMVNIIDQIIGAHIKALKDLGVDIAAMAKEASTKPESRPLEETLNK